MGLPTGPQKQRLLIALAVAVAVVVVASLVITLYEIPVSPSHTICVGETKVGNVTAWFPYAFVASPYQGTGSGELRIWANSSVNGTYRNLTTRVATDAAGGDVKLGEAAGGNWTVDTATNQTIEGSGFSYPCSSSLIAVLGPVNGPASDSFGGGTIATGLRNDTGLPSSFNASAHCESFGAPADCAMSTTFNLNFTVASGSINTCGKAGSFSMDLTGQELSVRVPFYWDSTLHYVPTGPVPLTGMTAWFNYTFPANGGIWQYQELPGYAGGTSGLVFSYSACAA